MNNGRYNKWVEHEKQEVNYWINGGNHIREIEHYEVEFKLTYDNCIHFRVHGHLDWFTADENMTLQELERCIISDIPYIKSIQFVNYFNSPIII